jgi:hypothetical protein
VYPIFAQNQYKIPFVSFRVRVNQKEFLTNSNFGILPNKLVYKFSFSNVLKMGKDEVYIDQSGNVYIDQSGNVYIDRSGNVYIDQSGNVYIGQSGNVYIGQSGNAKLVFKVFHYQDIYRRNL